MRDANRGRDLEVARKRRRQAILRQPIPPSDARIVALPVDQWLIRHRRRNPTWPQNVLSITNLPRPDQLPLTLTPNPTLNSLIHFYCGPVQDLPADAIVNAANEGMLGGGGVDGAIHKAAGPLLVRECAEIGGCTMGEARVTKGYNVPAGLIIHAVGPMGEDPAGLTRCYVTCMDLVNRHKLRSIAFCCISTGIFGYPQESAARVALEAVKGWLEGNWEVGHPLERIIFCCYSGEEQDVYRRWLPAIFPQEDVGVEGYERLGAPVPAL